MRVFVTGTGRCGTVSFREACEFMDNYTAGHETLCGFLDYPDNHIEVNPQFRVCISALIQKYPDALFVHLYRSRESCVQSLVALSGGAVMRAYYVLHPSVMRSGSLRDVAGCYYDFETRLIDMQIDKAEQHRKYRLEDWRIWWPEFWKAVNATGNYKASYESWKTPRNTRQERGEQ